MPFSRQPFSGFPFDDTEDRGQRFESELADIASRFPEFADQLRRPFSSQEGRRPRRTSGTNQDIYDRLLNFRARDGFPFSADFDDDPIFHTPHPYQPHHPEHFPEQTTTVPEHRFQQKVQQNCESTAPPPESASSSGAQEERKNLKHPNIQQSNTVDLGQKQEPVDDSRNQRSMSAPPENRAAPNKRFVSSINIPNLNQPQPPDASAMGGRMSSNQPDPPTSNKPNERIIPIHIEGRDEPVVPKNVQPEKIFGQRPGTFTQFLNKEQEQKDKQQEELQRQQEEYQRQQQELFQKQQEQKQESAPKPKPTPLDLIQNIQKDVNDLMSQVEKFEGKPKDKQYLYLDEMLTRNLLKLDNIETEGKDSIRQARREAIKCIEECIRVLEMKANNNETLLEKPTQEETKTEEVKEEKVQMEQEEPQKEALVVGGVSRSGSNAETKETMEVDEGSGNAKEVKQEEAEAEAETKVEEEKVEDASQGEEKKKVKKKSEKK